MEFDWENTTVDREALVERAQTGGGTAVIQLDGARDEVHAFGRTGHDFAAAMQAMATARSLGLALAVVTVVNRSNARVMSEMPALLRARRVQAWRVVFPRYEDEAGLIGRAPRLVLALPPILSALSRATKAGLQVQLVDAPLCLLGPLRSHGVQETTRSFGSPCEGCALRDGCSGVDAVYLARFGDRELRQVAEPG